MTAAAPTRARLTLPTRADILIKRAEDQAKRGTSEVGWLRGEVRNLCAELDAYKPHQSSGLTYINATLDKGLPVMLGVEGQGEDVCVVEVWCNGLDIEQHLSDDAQESLHRQAMATDAAMREDLRVEMQIDNLQHQREMA